MPPKSTLIFTVLLSFSIVIPNECFATSLVQESSPDFRQKLDADLEEVRADNDVPAMAIGIIENGKVYYKRGFGKTASGQVVTSNTKFRVASITKLFTAQAVMQLVEQGKLKLDDNVDKYLPEFTDQNISMLELMTHHSGLKDKVKPANEKAQRSINQYLQESIDKQGKLNRAHQENEDLAS